MRKELPHLLKKGMKHDAFVKAVRENFEAVAGQVGGLNDLLVFLGDPSKSEETIRELADASAGTFVDNLIEKLIEAGVGPEDGTAPADAPTNVQAIGGIGDWFAVVWDTIDNSSGVVYEIHAHTTNGFTPAANTRVGTWSNPGQVGGKGSFFVKMFPTGHVLAGNAIVTTTTYYVKVVATDGDGSGPASAQVSVSPFKVDATTVLTAGTIIGNLIVGSTITGDKISASTITADKLNVANLAAISATLGTVTSGTINTVTINAGTISGVTITGGTIRTASGGNHIEMTGTRADEIVFFLAGSEVAALKVGILNGTKLIVDTAGIAVDGASEFASTVDFSGLVSMVGASIDLNGNELRDIASDALKFNTKLTSATAGTQGDVPAQTAGYVRVTVEGTAYKIPLYNV